MRFMFMRRALGTLVALADFTAQCAAAPAPPPAASYPPMPEAVTSFGAATLDGWIFVYGGHRGERHAYNRDDVSGSFHRLSLGGGAAWEKLPGSAACQAAALVGYGQHLYRIGGMAARNRRGETNDLHSTAQVERFEVAAQRWHPLPPLPAPRSSHDAAVVGNHLYVGGGWQLQGTAGKAVWHDTLLVLDLADPAAGWQPLPQPFQRRALAVAAFGPMLCFVGGMNADGRTSQAVDFYDPEKRVWTAGPELPPGKMNGFGCSAVAQAGWLFYTGMKGELHRLSASRETWELAGHMAHPRFFHRLLPLGDRHLLIIGGEDSEAKRNDLEIILPSASALTAGSVAPTHQAPGSLPASRL